MRRILDSSVLIAPGREERSFVELLGDELRDRSAAIAAITASELLHVHRASTPRVGAHDLLIAATPLAHARTGW